MPEIEKAMDEVKDNICKTTKHVLIHKVVILEVFHREI